MKPGSDHGFDKQYWEQHWQQDGPVGVGSTEGNTPNPYLTRETGGLVPGTAFDAGCGAGAEAIWLALHGWQVTAADISTEALARAADRAEASGAPSVQWVEADLGVWDPGTTYDLVTTHYAHPAMSQLDFYNRIADWVAPGGALLIVGHLHTDSATDDVHVHGEVDSEDDGPPAEALATAAAVAARLGDTEWEIVTAEEQHRMLTGHDGREIPLHDFVVRAIRRS